MTAFVPTHRIGRAGAEIRTAPNPAEPPGARLDPRLPVQVDTEQQGWAHVVCANGFSGWIDATQLTGKANRTPALVVAGLVVVAALGAGAFLGGGDDDDGAPSGGGGPGATAPEAADVEVSLNVPDGWSVSDDGLVAAEDAADLDRDDPEGPVVRAETGDGADPDPEALVDDALDSADDLEFTEPEEQTIDGFAAVSISLRQGDRVQAFITVALGGGEAVLFVIDSPADRFDELRDLLAGVPGLET